MRAKAIAWAAVLSIWPAWGQNVDRVFHFSNTATPQARQELINAIRAIAGVRQAALDEGSGILTISGTASQAAMADWLFPALDLPADPQPANPSALEFHVPHASDDVVRIFYLTHSQIPQAIQELVNMIRAVGDVQRIAALHATRAIVLRGLVGQVQLAEWLIGEFDKPAAKSQETGVRQFEMKRLLLAVPEQYNPTAVRVFYPKRADAPQPMQEMINAIRSIVEIQRVVGYNPMKAVAWRATHEQSATAEWLVNQLDQPAGRPARSQLAGVRDGEVRVLYPPHAETPERLQEAAKVIRSTTGIQRLVAFGPSSALAMRGTGEQVARAEELLQERDKN